MEASDYSHKMHPTPKGCIAAPETPSRYFRALAVSRAGEAAASSNKLLQSDLSICLAPATVLFGRGVEGRNSFCFCSLPMTGLSRNPGIKGCC